MAGEIAQCDFWFPPVEVPVGFGQSRRQTQLPVLTMITGYARLGLSGAGPDPRGGRSVRRLVAADHRVGGGAVGVGVGRGGYGRAPELTQVCQAFRGVLGAKVVICKPRDPEAKGIIERLHDHLERSFLPGRSFESPAHFNTQLTGWLHVANSRTKRSLGCAPADRVGADTAAMMGLPPVPPVTGWEMSGWLARDHYVRLDSNDYSCTRRWSGGGS